MAHRIIYFYKMENIYYKPKAAGFLRKRMKVSLTDNVSLSEKELGASGAEEAAIKAYFCGIPEYCGYYIGRGRRKKYLHDTGQLLRVLQDCCEYVSADAYYLEENFEKELAERNLSLSFGKQRMCSEMIKNLSGHYRGIDSILYVAEEEEDRKEDGLPLKKQLLQKLHYFFYLGQESEQYYLLEKNLWEEYGMPVIRVRDVQELSACQLNRLLVLDDRKEGQIRWAKLPEACVYIDFWSDPERKRQIMENRTDIKYLSEYLYLTKNLDTFRENGYNSQSLMMN